jgi:hypothetical protein
LNAFDCTIVAKVECLQFYGWLLFCWTGLAPRRAVAVLPEKHLNVLDWHGFVKTTYVSGYYGDESVVLMTGVGKIWGNGG